MAEEYWQTARSTIRERSKFMFKNDLLSDVKFVVPACNATDGETEDQVIPAHKFVLSISSPVFYAMFYSEMADTKDLVELTDCDSDGLSELFRYMYSDEVNLTGSNVMQVMYLAKKYMVPSLSTKCAEFLLENLNADNVLSVLPHAEKYEEKKLLNRCWKVIDQRAEEALKSPPFVTIERSFLEEIVERDTLSIKEVELFKAIDLWATEDCKRQGLNPDGEVKRKIIGERIVKGVRFPVMKEKEFAAFVLDSNILSKQEAYDIIKYFNSVLNSPPSFSKAKRASFSIQRCFRFRSVNQGLWCRGVEPNSLIISVDKEIMLHGINLFAGNNRGNVVTMKISDVASDLDLVSKSESLDSEPVQSELGLYSQLCVLFDPPVTLENDKRYCVEAAISGPTVWYGTKGTSSVQCSGVTFKFEYNKNRNFGTKVEMGQFAEFLFTL